MAKVLRETVNGLFQAVQSLGGRLAVILRSKEQRHSPSGSTRPHICRKYDICCAVNIAAPVAILSAIALPHADHRYAPEQVMEQLRGAAGY